MNGKENGFKDIPADLQAVDESFPDSRTHRHHFGNHQCMPGRYDNRFLRVSSQLVGNIYDGQGIRFRYVGFKVNDQIGRASCRERV